jgi:L-ascorbate metabolism protein UlaG (beta-lactamase superfamily)
MPVDVSLPRRDSKVGAGHRGIAVSGDPALSIEEAARRRDFTMNALLFDPFLTGNPKAPVSPDQVRCDFILLSHGHNDHLGDMHQIDVALLPIGDNYTMGIDDAVKAVEFLRPRVTIPMHYNTFEMIACDPQEFVMKCEAISARVEVVEVGKSYEL